MCWEANQQKCSESWAREKVDKEAHNELLRDIGNVLVCSNVNVELVMKLQGEVRA